MHVLPMLLEDLFSSGLTVQKLEAKNRLLKLTRPFSGRRIKCNFIQC